MTTTARVLMPRPVPPETTMPKVSNAVVCLEPDCEAIFPNTIEHCPACGADGAFPLINWLVKGDAKENIDK